MISIIFSSNRVDPKFDWFIKSLFAQTTQDDRNDMEIIYVDYCKDDHAELPLKNEFNIIHIKPKDNIYQGANRKTTGEYFSPASARNTGVLLSSGDYLVFCDDVSVLVPGWWDCVKRNERRSLIVTGSYQKHFDMVVIDGELISSRSHFNGMDARWEQGSEHPVKIHGGALFGCSFGVPAEALIKVNGFDELCDSIGGEDYHLGLRLNHAGYHIWYDRHMMSIESEELHNQPHLMKREDRVMGKDMYMQRLGEFGISKRLAPGNWDSSHMILDILYGTKQERSIYNNYDISKDRKHKHIVPVADIQAHWFDHKPLTEMT